MRILRPARLPIRITVMEGRVKWSDDNKGYGFIATDSEEICSLHHKCIEGEGFKSLGEGDRVRFEEEFGNAKGPIAVNVKKLHRCCSKAGASECRKKNRPGTQAGLFSSYDRLNAVHEAGGVMKKLFFAGHSKARLFIEGKYEALKRLNPE